MACEQPFGQSHSTSGPDSTFFCAIYWQINKQRTSRLKTSRCKMCTRSVPWKETCINLVKRLVVHVEIHRLISVEKVFRIVLKIIVLGLLVVRPFMDHSTSYMTCAHIIHMLMHAMPNSSNVQYRWQFYAWHPRFPCNQIYC